MHPVQLPFLGSPACSKPCTRGTSSSSTTSPASGPGWPSGNRWRAWSSARTS